MSEFLSLCLRRQSCRSFLDKEIEQDILVKCVKAASLAPSACNSQPWSFVIVHSKDMVNKIAQCANVMGRNEFAFQAKAFFVVVEEFAVLMPAIRGLIDSQFFAVGDVGAATISLCLAATDEGLGTCVMGLFDREKVSNVLDIPREKKVRAVIAVGYPKDTDIREKTRKDLKEIYRLV